jgi:hypothetical protein
VRAVVHPGILVQQAMRHESHTHEASIRSRAGSPSGIGRVIAVRLVSG